MRFGSKGLDAPVIIGIVLAVIAAAIILYILWSRGVLPFSQGANEAECTAYFIRSCQAGPDFGDSVKNILCKSFMKKFSGYNECEFTNAEETCGNFCNSILSTS